VVAESLREELMELDGVAEAEVDEAADSPSGVRVRLEPDADARLVGVEVQRVLASHGLRSRITAQDDQEDEEESEPATAPDSEPEAEAAPEAGPEAGPEPVPEPAPEDVDDEQPEPLMEPAPIPPPTIPPPRLTPPPVVPTTEPAPAEPPPATAAGEAGLASVSVDESRDGVAVTATATDGRLVTQRSDATEAGMFAAAVSAVGTLAEGSPPELISVTPIDANGAQAITVVLERADGTKIAGAAVVKVSAGFAVGRATWAALRDA